LLEHRDLAIPPPPANLTSANQRRWLRVQQSQVNSDALRDVLGSGRDILIGNPLIGAVFAFALVKTLERTGVFGPTESDILKGLVVAGPFIDVLGKVGGAVGGIVGAVKGVGA